MLAVIGMVVTAPLVLLIAALVKLSSPGPVFFAQTRVGVDRRTSGRSAFDHRRRVNHGGRLFTIYKFRTIRIDRTRLQVWNSPEDSRVTGIGRVLRATRLDDLPQLLNVLTGDMNILGRSKLRRSIGRTSAMQTH